MRTRISNAAIDAAYRAHGYPAAALTRYERPIGKVTGYRVECRCGWKSEINANWQKSLHAHQDREFKKVGG